LLLNPPNTSINTFQTGSKKMDVFRLRDNVIHDYSEYATSFIEIRDPHIKNKVQQEMEAGAFWREPLIQLSPTFKPGATIPQLVREGILHQEAANIFLVGKARGERREMSLHTHQLEAIKIARAGHNYVLTTGTGSGKSLSYIVPIVDYVLRNGSGKGIQAIIIYPMNALANSQEGELKKFLQAGYDKAPVRFAKYTGQESDEQRREIIANPPDILLTNYVMLELILTRTKERLLIEQAKNLRFLVLDELHTYRGRQGADVALLIRRVRNRLGLEKLQIVGTSATLASEGTSTDQQRENARVATQIFGAEVLPEHIIGETLQRATEKPNLDDPSFRAALKTSLQDIDNPPRDYENFIKHPLSRWIEIAFGLRDEPETGKLLRRPPRSIAGANGAASELSSLIDIAEADAALAIEKWLMAGYQAEGQSETGIAPFAFRLHQFISPGDSVYASIETEKERFITVYGQRFVPGSEREKILFPLVFCRECGQEFYSARLVKQAEGEFNGKLEPRDFHDRQADDESEAGYFYLSSENPWPSDKNEFINRLPDDWIEEGKTGPKVKSNRNKNLPKVMRVTAKGERLENGTIGAFLSYPFLFCPCCGVSYDARTGDFGKLSSLNSEGRSSATTIISLSTILSLREEGERNPQSLPENARKMLSFTDNRQDASLQAGHFNDMVDIGLLRGALYRAVHDAGEKGLSDDKLTQAVFDSLDLPLEAYAENPEIDFQAIIDHTNKALRDVLGYHLYLDLRRGWRVTSPNLEQCGLLDIDYLGLTELAEKERVWANAHPALASASSQSRYEILKVLLDTMRRELAIYVRYLDKREQEAIRNRSHQRLNPRQRWALSEDDHMTYAAIAFPRSRREKDGENNIYISSRSGFGQYLRRPNTFGTYSEKLKMVDTDRIIPELMNGLLQAGLVRIAQEADDAKELPGYQVQADMMAWRVGTGQTAYFDPLRTPQQPKGGKRVNAFFVHFYTEMARLLKNLEAREHTAQVQYEDREEREANFRSGKLPVLYCSPTMELGVDISELNVVNMRNVPPTPANYAQRSGRAGRSGQPALIITYCSAGSPHDQYFFKRPEQMVAGAVAPPRLDLANEDLIRAHVQAIWLAESGINLGETLTDILDVNGNNPSLDLLENVRKDAENKAAHDRAFRRANTMLLELRAALEQTTWYHADWLDDVLKNVVNEFDATCERWRGLYRSALAQFRTQNTIIEDASRSSADKTQAKRLRRESEAQLKLLSERNTLAQSDFYSYRYFATEGFLPGYSFPRLPLSAFIPAQRGRERDEYLSRPRFLAISEFGPRALIYHEGSRYIINQVIMPVDDEGPLTQEMKQCENCSYIHRISSDINPDVCERCGWMLPKSMYDLMRLQNVVTRRRDRISSDEEERLRVGYEIRTGIRFAQTKDKQAAKQVADVRVNGERIAHLEYGQAASLWRINLGWARRKEKTQHGFVLDLERGYWGKNEQETTEDKADPLSARTCRVIPYVEDSRNCLIFQPVNALELEEMLSLQMALKRGIEALYQLEDNELAVEPLPSADAPRMLLFYEAAEGGAGVLRRLIDDRQALSRVAAAAMQICHYDPQTGQDEHHAPHAKERCESACYDCLMSYSNQGLHDLLNRHLAAELLMVLMEAEVDSSPSAAPRSEHMAMLLKFCESDLEKKWLQALADRGLRLPDEAQYLYEDCHTRFDFVYKDKRVAIYVDGSHHNAEHQKRDDAEIDECLLANGISPLRFRYDADWNALFDEYSYVFGGAE
jgi:ATP-dependent helicase YprA (DUF1998 family)/very-short-patch-repair endonuclease